MFDALVGRLKKSVTHSTVLVIAGNITFKRGQGWQTHKQVIYKSVSRCRLHKGWWSISGLARRTEVRGWRGPWHPRKIHLERGGDAHEEVFGRRSLPCGGGKKGEREGGREGEGIHVVTFLSFRQSCSIDRPNQKPEGGRALLAGCPWRAASCSPKQASLWGVRSRSEAPSQGNYYSRKHIYNNSFFF